MLDRDLFSDVDVYDRNMTDIPTNEYKMIPLDNMAVMNMPGGVIVLELNVNDYSMQQIARIVEENNAKILSSYVTSLADTFKMEVTLKINQTDLTSIIQSFQRFGYIIKASFHGKNRQEEILQKNYDQFMLYLNV